MASAHRPFTRIFLLFLKEIGCENLHARLSGYFNLDAHSLGALRVYPTAFGCFRRFAITMGFSQASRF